MCVIFLIGFVADWTVDGRHCPLWYTNCTQTVQGNFSLSLCNGYCSSQFCYIGSEDIVYRFVLGVKRVSSMRNVARRPLGRIFSDNTKDQTCFCFNEVLKCNKGKQGRTLSPENTIYKMYTSCFHSMLYLFTLSLRMATFTLESTMIGLWLFLPVTDQQNLRELWLSCNQRFV